MLKIEDMHVYYGAIHAIKGVSFEVKEGEIVALIGANGAGKSTILKTVSGLMHPRSGSISFCGQVSKIKDLQTDKDGFTIALYVDDVEGKNAFVEAAKAKGYDILEMNGQLDSHYIQYFESKNEKIRFVRVDSDVVENLIRKE